MGRITVRVDDWMHDGIESLTDGTSLTASDIVRRGIRAVFDEWADELPEWVERESSHDQVVKENRPGLRSMHFKQRSYEYVKNCLTNDRGKVARYPPDPEKLEAHYLDKLHEEIQNEHPEYEEEYTEHVEYLADWYRLMHPDHQHEDKLGEVLAVAEFHFRHGEAHEARKAVEHAGENGRLGTQSPHEILDEARQNAADESWRHEWNDAMRGTT